MTQATVPIQPFPRPGDTWTYQDPGQPRRPVKVHSVIRSEARGMDLVTRKPWRCMASRMQSGSRGCMFVSHDDASTFGDGPLERVRTFRADAKPRPPRIIMPVGVSKQAMRAAVAAYLRDGLTAVDIARKESWSEDLVRHFVRDEQAVYKLTGAPLLTWWKERLKPVDSKVLASAVNAWPEQVPREHLERETGYRRTTVSDSVVRLGSLGLVTHDRIGVRAVDMFGGTT